MPKTATADYLDRYPKVSISTYKDDLRRITDAGQTPTFKLDYTLSGKQYKYSIQVTSTPCHYGGLRYWWNCPNCHKRVGVLYRAGLYVCRHCLGLNYYSQHKHTYQRPDSRMEAIRKRLDWHNNPYRKPKGMHYKTYKRLFMEYHDIEEYYLSCLTMFDSVTSVKRYK